MFRDFVTARMARWGDPEGRRGGQKVESNFRIFSEMITERLMKYLNWFFNIWLVVFYTFFFSSTSQRSRLYFFIEKVWFQIFKKKRKSHTIIHRLMSNEVYLRDDLAVNVRPSSQSSGNCCFSSSSTVSLSTSLM